jgi:hypothetical protein
MQSRMVRSLLAALAVAASLAGCSAGPLSDSLKQMPESLGGLPPDAPKSPAMPYQYPAVHDMPPPRSTEPMSEDQQYQMEKELNAIRDRQERALVKEKDRQPATDAAKAMKKPANKPAAAAQNGQNAGAGTGTKTNP